MFGSPSIRPVAIDLARYRKRAVASLYSSLVTRPTGRAVRLGVEGLIAELPSDAPFHVLVLDFAQVRVLDFSCADEIVAKLLLRYVTGERAFPPRYFLARGVRDSHAEAIQAVLERHRLMLSVEMVDGGRALLGPAPDPLRCCWDAIVRSERFRITDGGESGLDRGSLMHSIGVLTEQRLVVPWEDGSVSALFALGRAVDE